MSLTHIITVNGGANVTLDVNPELHGYSWQGNATGSNLENYTISNGKVVWNDGTILQYDAVDVLPTDDIISNGAYTTRAVEPNYVTLKFNDKMPDSLQGSYDNKINFICNGVSYTRINTTGKPNGIYYGDTQAYSWVTNTWNNTAYQIIKVDTNSTDYALFVTWAKANGGVLLEAGTYKWVNIFTERTEDLYPTFNFKSNNTNFDNMSYSYENRLIEYCSGEDCISVLDHDIWTNEAYKTITTTTDQYVNYDFYNYAITGRQLVKQAADPTTGTIKFGTAAPTKYYLGNKAVDRIYMGTVLLYKKAIVYTITANLANCTANSDNPITIEENGGAILYYTANEGYELPDGVELTNVGSYNWDKVTGKLVIARPNGNVTIKIVAKQSLSQLATPQNVSVENTTLSFDEVENAEEYEVFVDNTSIGSYQVSKGEEWVLNESPNAPSSNIDVSIDFQSNNENFKSINIPRLPQFARDGIIYYNIDGNAVIAYDGNTSSWANNAYRTLTFETAPTGTLLTWLQTNGVKQ